MMQSDSELLRCYVREGSEADFAELVQRHVNLVYSAAARQLGGEAHLVEDVAQVVFIALARKAPALIRHTSLTGWLYTSVRFAASEMRRREHRRQQREQDAFEMSELQWKEQMDPAWEQMRPVLDEAMHQLNERDRHAVLLRYFEGKPLAEVGAALRLSENAARMRVGRALDKLRALLAKRGVAATTTVVAALVSAHSVHGAPAGLAATIAGTAAKGSAVSASTITLMEGVLKLMAWSKAKTGIVTAAAIVLTVGTGTIVVRQVIRPSPTEVIENARQAYASLSSYRDSGSVVTEMSGAQMTTTFSIRLARPNLYRIEWEQSSPPSRGLVWSAGQGDFVQVGEGNPERKRDQATALAAATGISGGAAATIPGTFFNQNWGNALRPLPQAQMQGDERVGGVDCYVFEGDYGAGPVAVWIGKEDYLIRQTRTRLTAPIQAVVTETHENISVNEPFSSQDFEQ